MRLTSIAARPGVVRDDGSITTPLELASVVLHWRQVGPTIPVCWETHVPGPADTRGKVLDLDLSRDGRLVAWIDVWARRLPAETCMSPGWILDGYDDGRLWPARMAHLTLTLDPADHDQLDELWILEVPA